MFEASVGGGIPIIRPLNESLTADEITQITGILKWYNQLHAYRDVEKGS